MKYYYCGGESGVGVVYGEHYIVVNNNNEISTIIYMSNKSHIVHNLSNPKPIEKYNLPKRAKEITEKQFKREMFQIML